MKFWLSNENCNLHTFILGIKKNLRTSHAQTMECSLPLDGVRALKILTSTINECKVWFSLQIKISFSPVRPNRVSFDNRYWSSACWNQLRNRVRARKNFDFWIWSWVGASDPKWPATKKNFVAQIDRVLIWELRGWNFISELVSGSRQRQKSEFSWRASYGKKKFLISNQNQNFIFSDAVLLTRFWFLTLLGGGYELRYEISAS